MKLSIADMFKGDTEHDALCRRVLVKLDGKLRNHVLEADEEAGYVVVYIPETDPRFHSERLKQGRYEWPSETLRGKVQIIDPQRPNMERIHDAYSK